MSSRMNIYQRQYLLDIFQFHLKSGIVVGVEVGFYPAEPTSEFNQQQIFDKVAHFRGNDMSFYFRSIELILYLLSRI